ncbi:MAG TPA: hypothetical protein PKA05_14720, partial [Roseiflexaceae bacterium]|nr:hypothetical protein [Roseiflexaceae bacterium]
MRGSDRGGMPSGLSWRFRHWLYSGSAHLDDYGEVRGAAHRSGEVLTTSYDMRGLPHAVPAIALRAPTLGRP